jgi:hypothetical protein
MTIDWPAEGLIHISDGDGSCLRRSSKQQSNQYPYPFIYAAFALLVELL